MSNGGRRAELDGVRGIAILLVLVGHADHRLAPLASAGVAVFFTLSGYLITGLLLAEREKRGRLDLRRFYARRMTRLAPPLLVMLAVMAPFLGPLWSRAIAPAVWLGNYAALAGFNIEPFGHAWSLAVEEQFYLVWPLALPLLLRARRPVVALGGVVLVLTLWRMAVTATGHFDYAYMALETAGVSILAGCLIAVAKVRLPGNRAVPSLLGLVALGSVGLVGGEGAYRLVPLAAMPLTFALVASAHGARWLTWRPLAFCGVASYSLYLWHKPVAWLVSGDLTPFGVLVGAGVGLVAFWALEAPLMRWREGQRAPVSEVPEPPQAVLLRA